MEISRKCSLTFIVGAIIGFSCSYFLLNVYKWEVINKSKFNYLRMLKVQENLRRSYNNLSHIYYQETNFSHLTQTNFSEGKKTIKNLLIKLKFMKI